MLPLPWRKLDLRLQQRLRNPRFHLHLHFRLLRLRQPTPSQLRTQAQPHTMHPRQRLISHLYLLVRLSPGPSRSFSRAHREMTASPA